MMLRARNVLLAFACVATTIAATHDGAACSCAGPRLVLVGPDRADDVPLNARVRVESPGGTANVVLRAHGGAVVPTTARVVAPGGALSTVELTPTAPLTPGVQYEIATIDPTAHPSVIVVGTFKTGSVIDSVPPVLDPLGRATATRNPRPMGSMCQVGGPWITIEGVAADDQGRPSARLVFGVWLADASGTVDPKLPPTAIVSAHDRAIVLGQRSLCDPHSFPFPKSPSVVLGIAALDEAGNASPIRKIRVDLAGAKTP